MARAHPLEYGPGGGCQPAFAVPLVYSKKGKGNLPEDGRRDYGGRICFRVYFQFIIKTESMGLFPKTVESVGADLPALLLPVVSFGGAYQDYMPRDPRNL